MVTHRARFLPLLLPGLATLAMGCGGYTSSYVPPPDGRPRLVWSDDKPVPMMSNPMPEACSEAVGSLAGGSGSVRVGGRVGGGGYVSGGYYIPGRTIVVVHGGPAFVPVPHPIGLPLTGGGRGGGGIGGIGRIGGGGGGGSGDLGKGAVLLVVVAIATLPFIALGLAVGRPEPEEQVAAAIDQVNAQTDLARTEGSPCDEMTVAGEGAAQ